MKKKVILFTLSILMAVLVSACGYSTKGLLPTHIKTVYVEPFTNNTYESQLETDFTNVLTNRFINDGNLKVAKKEEADLIVTGTLLDFRREPLRHDADREVEEYRIVIISDVSVEDATRQKLMWEENNFGGDSSYFTSGTLATTEQAARDAAIEDLARRIVNRTVEDW